MIHNHWEWQLSQACMYVRTYVRTHINIYIYIHIYIYTWVTDQRVTHQSCFCTPAKYMKIQFPSETRSFIQNLFFWFLPTTNHWHTLSPQSRVFGAARHDNVQFVASHMASKHSKKCNKTQNSQKNEKNIVSSPLQGKLNRISLFSFNFNQNEIGWKWMKMNDIPRGQSVPMRSPYLQEDICTYIG